MEERGNQALNSHGTDRLAALGRILSVGLEEVDSIGRQRLFKLVFWIWNSVFSSVQYAIPTNSGLKNDHYDKCQRPQSEQ